MALVLSDGQTLLQIASDGGLLEQPIAVKMLRLAPGERAEVVVDLQAGKKVSLANAHGYWFTANKAAFY